MLAAGLALLAPAAWAQAPAITSLVPGRHAVAAPRPGPVEVNFTQPITAASAGGLRVYGGQLRGRRPGTLSGGGTTTRRFTPTQPFAPGERVRVSLPATLLNTAGTGLRAQVYQFTAATGGSGRGVFLDTTEVAYTNSRDQLLADMDNDGDLDLLTSNLGSSSVTVRLNSGLGSFGTGPSLAVGFAPVDLAVADFDGNGSPDVLTANASNLSIALNGSGVFGSATNLALPAGSSPTGLSVGDVDADGNLDFVVALGTGGQVITFLNNGSAGFAAQAGPLVLGPAGRAAVGATLGDVDGDGDLDLITASGGRVVLARGGVAPTLSGFSPAAGAPGTVISLTGTALGGTRRISFAGAAGNVVSSGFAVNTAGTQITGVVVPNGAITGPVRVTTASGTAASSASFGVVAAQLTVLQNGAPYLPASPGFDFGNQLVGTASSPITFTLSNPGSLPLTIGGATTTGDFALTGATPGAVPAGGSATVATSTSTGGNLISTTTPDASGNLYLSGVFYGQLTLGSFVLTNSGSGSVPYLAKWNPATNTYLWAQVIAAADGSIGAVAVSGTSVYLAGSFYDRAIFGTTTFNTAGRNVFIAKMTDAGSPASFNWALSGGGPGFDFISAMAVQGPNLYVAGSFGESYPAGLSYNAIFGGTTLLSAGQSDVFVAKVVDAGPAASYAWAVRAGGSEREAASALAVQGSSVYVGGSFFSNDAAFGPVTLRNPITYGQIATDGFVAKLTDTGSTGSFVWAQQLGGAGLDDLTALVAQGPNIYVAGTYINSATFGTLAVGSATAFGGGNAYVAKLLDGGAAGSFVWVQPIGTAGFGSTNAQALALSGRHLYVTGGGYSGARFGTATLHTVGNTLDCYLAKILDAGSTSAFAWLQQGGGGTNYDQGLALALSGSSVYVGGYVQQGVTFGPLSANNTSSPNVYSFVASLTDVALLATQAPTSGPRAALSLFPNPAHATATVQLPPTAAATTAVLTLSDALGRTCRTQTVAVPAAGRSLALDLTGLAPGVYVVHVVVGGAPLTSRLVVE